MKNIAVYENGYLGLRQIANVQVPLNPQVRKYNGGYIPEEILSYKGRGLVLEIHQLKIAGLPLNGATVMLSLPGYQAETVILNCERVK